ncbi:helix-hairpin-helix domain-containing protein [Sporosarcina trichiuri]|uniref:helix-hairpin-helix domain-containing protein n=1 Tax=Sporosarcina trichiuri TaxID=3056445 RepID=UPI0025B31162|nr:helix-hairpin-helix domain-containing protein [Sporosarcina sp. 0.2-SM1T-5]WJY28524.1 helix-hairpin-helix domain-containing protein [Sporosarcina sp. 0.2-SM1T-5]
MTPLFSELLFGKWRKVTTPLAIAAVISAILFFPRGQADTGLLPQNDNFNTPQAALPEDGRPEDPAETAEDAEPLVPPPVMVDVKGAVLHPNVYTFEEGQRVIDAITAAGGYAESADSRLLNHAQLLADQMVIYVPAEGEEMPVFESAGISETVQGSGSSALININTADETELMTLNGIGPAKASAIIAYRTDNGTFQTAEDLMKVSGIGQKTFDALADAITVK